MKWTPEMMAAVKGNDVPHGLLKANEARYYGPGAPIWRLIEEAFKDGALVEMYAYDGRWIALNEYKPIWSNWITYRIASDWQPKSEEPPKEQKPVTLKRLHFDEGQCYEISETYGPDGHMQNMTQRYCGTAADWLRDHP